jgi:hypothetical protein
MKELIIEHKIYLQKIIEDLLEGYLGSIAKKKKIIKNKFFFFFYENHFPHINNRMAASNESSLIYR